MKLRLGYLAAFVAGAAVSLAGWFLAGFGGRLDRSALLGPLAVSARTNSSASGPWGKLEYEPLELRPGNLGPYLGTQANSQKWFFPDFSAAEVRSLLLGAGLTPAASACLLDTNRWEPFTNGYAIRVPDETILNLGQTAAQRIYPVLARSPLNHSQYFPFRFSPSGFDARFSGSGLSPAQVATFRGLTYTNGPWLCFCAAEACRSGLTTNEYAALLKVLYRVPTLRMHLRVTPDSDLEALVKYWGAGGRASGVRPLLEALARNPGGGSINVACLLPPFARSRLYMYPEAIADPAAAQEDCFFSALNFFNDPPDVRFLDLETTRNTLRTEYRAVGDPPVFGDLLALLDEKGGGIHACIYVADEVVFTKNGETALEPWVLMRMPDLLACYAPDKPPRVLHLRRKDPAYAGGFRHSDPLTVALALPSANH
jgi:hypothetical protein